MKVSSEETLYKNVDWTNLAKDKDKWKPAVKTIMKFRVP
jgi:hypothetical protein